MFSSLVRCQFFHLLRRGDFGQQGMDVLGSSLLVDGMSSPLILM
jgi:hypothetical protein